MYRIIQLCAVCLLMLVLIQPNMAVANLPDLKNTKHLKNLIRSTKVLKSGRFTNFKSMRVTLENGKKLSVPKLAARIFSRHVKRNKKLVLARKNNLILGAPVIKELAQETKDFVVLTRRTSFVVVDAKKMRRSFPNMLRIGSKKKLATRNDFTLNKMSKKEKQALATLKAATKKKAKDHPLRIALEKDGTRGLLAAAFNGVGEVYEIETVVVPKRARTASGKRRVPILGNKGITFKTIVPIGHVQKQNAKKPFKSGFNKPVATQTQKWGQPGAKVDVPIITGVTEEKSWFQTTTFGGDVASATFTTDFGFYYHFRVPIAMSWQLNPMVTGTNSNVRVGTDHDTQVNLALTAAPSNQSKSFYEQAGTPASLVKSGYEIAAGAWARLAVKGYILGVKVFSLDLGAPKEAAMNCPKPNAPCFYRHIQPNWGKKKLKFVEKGKLVPAEVWLPAALTQSFMVINVGVISGFLRARLGVKFWSAHSQAKVDFNSYVDGQSTGQKTITFNPPSSSSGVSQKNVKFTVPAIPSVPQTTKIKKRSYGFKISNPRYKTTVNGIPGLNIEAGISPGWSSKNFLMGKKVFFSAYQFTLFDGELGAFPGTNSVMNHKAVGSKVYKWTP